MKHPKVLFCCLVAAQMTAQLPGRAASPAPAETISAQQSPNGSAIPTLPGKPLLSNAKSGFFVHYVRGRTWVSANNSRNTKSHNEVADALDVDAVVRVAKDAGAEYLIFTVYHAGMLLMYPSPLWGGVFPDKISRRDVIGELADAAQKQGLPLVLYVHPNDRHDLSQSEQQKLIDLGLAESVVTRDPIGVERTGDQQFTGLRGADKKWNEFYFKLIDEIGRRYGSRVAGYWQDGPGPDGLKVREIMLKHTPNAAIWVNSAASRPDLPPATLLGGEYLAKPSANPADRLSATTSQQNSISISKDWWGTPGKAIYPPEALFRMTLTMAATKGQENGGFVMAAGPMADNSWGSGVVETAKAHGDLMKRFGLWIYNTVPSSAYPTTSLRDQPAWGVATETQDRSTVYLHVLRPPTSTTLKPGLPKDSSRFAQARLLPGDKPVKLEQTAEQITITLPNGTVWDPLDTVIALTVEK